MKSTTTTDCGDQNVAAPRNKIFEHYLLVRTISFVIVVRLRYFWLTSWQTQLIAMVENQTQTFHLDSNWLESVNILLVRPTTKSSDYDYELCNIESFSAEFIQNRIKRRFLPTINLMESDFAPEWWTILNETVDNFKEEQNKSNFILSNVDNQTRQKAIKQFGQKVLDSSLALRIAAIRCLFQELGKL